MPALSFYRPDALPAAQPTVSKHWRHPQLNCMLYSHCTDACLLTISGDPTVCITQLSLITKTSFLCQNAAFRISPQFRSPLTTAVEFVEIYISWIAICCSMGHTGCFHQHLHRHAAVVDVQSVTGSPSCTGSASLSLPGTAHLHNG